MERIKLATLWFGGCSGCHMSFLDVDEFLFDLAELVEVVYSPLVDTKVYPENVDVVLIEGSVCNEDHVEMATMIRERTQIVVSFGDCAVTSNVTGMRNALGGPEVVLNRSYFELADVNPMVPHDPGIVPPLLPRAIPLHQVIKVDHFLPGCPPPADRIKLFLEGLLAGDPKLEGPMLKFG